MQTNDRNVILRMVVDIALALHLAAAAGYLWLSPKGFPISSDRFWMNSVLPAVLIAITSAGLVAMHRHQWSAAESAVLFFATMWLAGAIFGRIVFPISLRGIWVLPLIIAAVGFVCFWGLICGKHRAYKLWPLSATSAALLAMFAIWAQVAPIASTKPINAHPPPSVVQERQAVSETILRLGADYEFDAPNAQLTMDTGRIRVQCVPLLDFDRISPDRFWSIFAPAKRNGRRPTAKSIRNAYPTIYYSDDSTIEFAAPSAVGSLRLTAITALRQDTYSRLNTYCYFEIGGHNRLSLSFSPCPDTEIEVTPADYPTGRPARFAYLDSANNFCVVEATSGEKGPFRRLAAGELRRGEPLTIAVRDKSRPVVWITLEDWSQQVSTELSPTAGWKLPMNAIEFRRFDDDLSSPAAIWITLAATAIGRGWETVGHCAGTYRNGIEFRKSVPLDTEPR